MSWDLQAAPQAPSTPTALRRRGLGVSPCLRITDQSVRPPPPGALFKSRSGFSSSGLSPRLCTANLTNSQVMPTLQGPPLRSQWCEWGCAVTKPCRPQLHVWCAGQLPTPPTPGFRAERLSPRARWGALAASLPGVGGCRLHGSVQG